MKKYLSMIIAALVLVTALAIPGLAAGGSAAVSSASAASGENVTMTLSLAGFEQATSVGVRISTDLDMVGGSWLLAGGVVSNVNHSSKGAVWTTSGTVSVNGSVLSMQFKLPAYDGTKSYPVSVTVEVKNNGTVLGTVYATGNVTVNNPTQSVALNKTSLALDLSGTKTAALTATLTPANATDSVVWTSSDSTVASVSNGTVTALKAGNATITATAGGKSASCTVTVTCSHSGAEKVDANEATCEKTGNNAYWSCADCGKTLKADKTTETTVAAETIPLVDHKGGTATCTQQAVCTMCNKPYGKTKDHYFSDEWESDANQHWHLCTTCQTEKEGLENHAYEWVVDEPATEDETGLKHEECICGSKRNENTEIPKLDHVHIGIKKQKAVAATCTKTGTVEHWTCSSSKCDGKYYKDSKCQILLETIEEPINPDKHSGKGSYEHDDEQHWQVCSDCNGIMGKKANHSWRVVYDKYPSESKTGLSHEACKTCKAEQKHNTVVPKLVHSPKKVAGKEATCTEAGVAEHFYCKNCNCYYESVDGTRGARVEEKSLNIEALGHSYAEEWVGDTTGHWHVCTRCDEKSEIEAHTTELKDAVEATEEAEGYTGDEVCTVCNTCVTKGAVIPVIKIEETTVPPTEEPTVAPTEPAVVDDNTGNGLTIVVIVLAAAAAAGGAALIFLKKK